MTTPPPPPEKVECKNVLFSVWLGAGGILGAVETFLIDQGVDALNLQNDTNPQKQMEEAR